MATRTAPLILTLLVSHGALLCHGQCVNMSDFQTRLDTLLAEYDREAPPEAPVAVELTLELRHASIDERSATARMLADLRLSWTDGRITWNTSEWSCDSTAVPAERLWLPDVELLSAAARGGAALLAQLTADGRLVWHVRLDVAAPVDMHLERWPFDEHTVVYKFGSKSRNVDELELQLSEETHSIVFEAGAWDLASVVGSRKKQQRWGAERWLVSWHVRLRRRAGAHARAAGAVFAAAVMMLVAASLLPPGDRYGLCAAAAFTAALWLVSCVARLPGSSTSPLVVRVAGALCAAGGAAAAGAALVRRVAGARTPPPAPLCRLLSAVSAFCRLTPHQEGDDMDTSEPPNGTAAWRAAALLLDRALLAALALTLVVLVGCTITALAV